MVFIDALSIRFQLITAGRKRCRKFQCVSPVRKKIVTSITNDSKLAALRHCSLYAKHYLHGFVASLVKKEIKVMCSKRVNSVLQNTSPQMLETFRMDMFLAELKQHAPLLFSILNVCTGNRIGIIGLCASILIRTRCYKMSLLQKIVAIILYSGHCSKMVCLIHCDSCSVHATILTCRSSIDYTDWD